MPAINESKLQELEAFVRLWGKLTKSQAEELIAAYRTDALSVTAKLNKPLGKQS